MGTLHAIILAKAVSDIMWQRFYFEKELGYGQRQASVLSIIP